MLFYWPKTLALDTGYNDVIDEEEEEEEELV